MKGFLMVAFPVIVLLVGCASAAPKAPLPTAPSSPTSAPQPMLSMTFAELAETYQKLGPEGISVRLGGRRIRLAGIYTGGLSETGWTGNEFTTFSIDLSQDGRSFGGLPINPQTGQVLQRAYLDVVVCEQRKSLTPSIERRSNYGLFKLEESQPPPKSQVVVEGTFYFSLPHHAFPRISDCQIISATPAPGSVPGAIPRR